MKQNLAHSGDNDRSTPVEEKDICEALLSGRNERVVRAPPLQHYRHVGPHRACACIRSWPVRLYLSFHSTHREAANHVLSKQDG
jgi:hypothetical protein